MINPADTRLSTGSGSHRAPDDTAGRAPRDRESVVQDAASMSTAVVPPQAEPLGDTTARLSLWLERGKGLSDGAWWPQSTSLRGEIPDLDVTVHHLTGARIARVAYAFERWAPAPRKLRTPLGMTQLGWFKGGLRPENIDLTLTDYTTLVLTVIPPETDPALAQQMLDEGGHLALTAAMTPTERALDRWANEGGHAPPGPHAEARTGYDVQHERPATKDRPHQLHEPLSPSSRIQPSSAGRESGAAQTSYAQETVNGGQARSETDQLAFRQALAEMQDLADGAMGGVEGLDRASCSPNIKYLAEIGMGAAARGCSQDGWRAQVAKTQGLDATRELDEAEECMRHSGLWPWA